MKTRIEILGIVRSLLSAIGAFMLGLNLFGTQITESWWQEAIGVILVIMGIVWSIKDKIATIEMIQGAMRQVITFLGGIALTAGWVTEKTLLAVIGLITAVIPVFQGYFSRKKARDLETGKLNIEQLKK